MRPDGFEGDLGSERANHAVGDDTQGLLAAGRSGILSYGPDGERLDAGMRVFFASYAPPPRMLVFGAIDFASALARLGTFLGYRVTVCDARRSFRDARALSRCRRGGQRLAAPLPCRAAGTGPGG